MSIVIFVVILLVLVLVHEFGHFFSAKKFGIRVDEFGFGFPPKLFGKKYGETEYTFNLLPLGGFVKIFGETPDEESISGPDRERSFISKAKWKQAVVLVAGVFMNFVLAWILFSFGFMSGLPSSVGAFPEEKLRDVNLVITSVSPGSPAEKAGLKIGDRIISLDVPGKTIEKVDPDTVKSFVLDSQGKEMTISYSRNKEIYMPKINPALNEETGEYIIGISMDRIGVAQLPLIQAFWEGMKLTLDVTVGTVVGLFGLIADALRGDGDMTAVTGPVGMVGIVGDAYEFGFAYLLSFAALISINLAIINLFPFPALDGGRLFFLLIEKIKGSPIKPSIANTANMIGFFILIALMLFITYHDIVKLF